MCSHLDSLLSPSFRFNVPTFHRQYVPDLERARATREKALQDAKADSMDRMMKDLEVDRAQHPEAAAQDRWDPEEENEEGEDEDVDVNIIDRSMPSLMFLQRER